TTGAVLFLWRLLLLLALLAVLHVVTSIPVPDVRHVTSSARAVSAAAAACLVCPDRILIVLGPMLLSVVVSVLLLSLGDGRRALRDVECCLPYLRMSVCKLVQGVCRVHGRVFVRE